MKKGREVIVANEWYTSLIPIDDPLPCSRCGQPASWRTSRQKVKGLHPLCQPDTWRTTASSMLHWATVELVVKTLGVVSIGEANQKTTPIAPKDIGPCAKCHTPHRRYGAFGKPLCDECEEGS